MGCFFLIFYFVGEVSCGGRVGGRGESSWKREGGGGGKFLGEI